jgi:hypothetical protein
LVCGILHHLVSLVWINKRNELDGVVSIIFSFMYGLIWFWDCSQTILPTVKVDCWDVAILSRVVKETAHGARSQIPRATREGVRSTATRYSSDSLATGVHACPDGF